MLSAAGDLNMAPTITIVENGGLGLAEYYGGAICHY
jgi:hypothetical protein